MPNTAQPVNLEKLNLLKTPVIDAVVEKAILEKRAFDEKMQPQLHEQLEQLEKLKTKQETQMELDLGNKLISVQQSQRLKKQKYIDKVFAEYQTWVEDTWQTEAVPYIQLIAVLAPTKQEQK
jgi:acetyl-CoA carboxylase alpha subunit